MKTLIRGFGHTMELYQFKTSHDQWQGRQCQLSGTCLSEHLKVLVFLKRTLEDFFFFYQVYKNDLL